MSVASAAAPNDSTTRNCESASGPLNSTLPNDKIDGDGGGVKTPSSPALSRISVAAGGLHRNDEDAHPTTADEKSRPFSARRGHGDTHKHHGLPDTIEDAVYRSLQTKRHKHPGLGLNGCWPKCSAVAYKSFNDPGPTQCSKLRVYRPKTSSSSGGDGDGEKKTCGKDLRPKTCVPVMTAQQLTDIKLALCWDLDAPFDRNRPRPRPVDKPAVFHKVQQQQPCENEFGGSGERKPQNSSAVMGFVPAVPASGTGDGNENNAPETRQTQNRNLSAVMELIANKDSVKPTEMAACNGNVDRTPTTNKPSSSSSSSVYRSKNGSDGDEKPNNNDDRGQDKPDGDDDDADVGTRRRRQRRRSLGDLTSDGHENAAIAEKEMLQQLQQQKQRHVFRSCLACEEPVVAAGHHRKEHDECNHYKMAFKAGVPISTPIKYRAAAANKPAKYLRVPKPKTTNSDKKKYVIGTLLPPFSMWPGTTARDYPEHWRLTSVYRQAFKPLELRKQPLLQTIYL